MISLTDFATDQVPSGALLEAWAATARRGGLALSVAWRVAEAERNATTDLLTGLPNRRALAGATRRELSRAARAGDRMGVAVLDIDHFRKVNNQHGHDAGDAVLREFGRRLTHAFRETDVVARWGGEEFVVILPSMGADPGPEDLGPVDRARELIERRPFRLPRGLGEIRVTFSAGVAVYPDNGTDEDSLRRAADAALYRAKAAGRNRVELAD